MRANRPQTTLAAPCTVSGRGYWTGHPNTLTFLPAEEGSGVRFERADLDGAPDVLAVSENRSSMPLRTRLTRGRAEVDMVEHVMAALYGLQIDNVLVRCTAFEMPAMDGSSLPFALVLESAGKREQVLPRDTWRIDRTLRVGNDDQWLVAEPHVLPQDNHLELEYHLDFGPTSPIGKATYTYRLHPPNFSQELAAARTFITLETARQLQAQGLGGHVNERDLLVFDTNGPIHNHLRFPDECARHKLLDLVGDLALSGIDLVGRIVAHRSGHQLNGVMAEQLRDLAKAASCVAATRLQAA
ncbi:MAG: UDP-3-O-acyl-N-acetylglucosamine deacetylase [Planctomycetales bacterium]|nr:UDP-3-O-acyl-N-acetylglucosamine deacetylase [Planctomycetales bacterium]